MGGRRALLAATAVLAALLTAAGSARAASGDDGRICTETLVTMSGGVRLHAWVSRLPPDRPRPVLFMMDSYARGGKPGQGPSNDNACPQVLPDDYVPAYLSKELTDRFTLVQVSYRGTGSSEGLFDVTGAHTQQDVREAIAWAAAGPWSNGNLVLIGESGTGFAAFHGLREPHVKAALIFTSCADMYRCVYRGGQYNGLGDVYMAATNGGYVGGMDARLRLGTAMNPDPAQQLAALTQASTQMKADAVDDPWWRERSALDGLPDVSIPVMYTSDLYDIVQPFDALQLTRRARFNLGMGHQSADVVAAGGDRYKQLVREPVDRFVAHYGLGESNGAERDPRVTLATGTGGVGAFHDGRLLVRSETDWPLPSTDWTRLFLGSKTLASRRARAGSDSAAVLSAPHADMRTTSWLLGPGGGPSDLRDDERSGLTYTTPALERDLEVTGPIALRLFASATAPDFDWAVRIADVAPDGSSQWITDGYLRASLRHVDPRRSLRDDRGRVVRPWLTYDRPEPVPIGAPVEYAIDVIGTSNVFRAGHRLRLDVQPLAADGLDSPRTGGAGAVTVLRDSAHPSSLSLPVIPRRCQTATPLVDPTPRVACAASYAQAIGGRK